MAAPTTLYAKSGGTSIAYQVVGDGPVDLVYVIGWVSNIETVWEEPSYESFLRRLASFSRLIMFDKRGCGLSDRVNLNDLPTMEQRMDDMRAVMNAAGSERAALLGISEGGPLCILFGATYPERTHSISVIGGYASGLHATAGIGARTDEAWDKMVAYLERHWGDDAARETLRDRAPSRYNDMAFRDWWARYLRLSVSPSAAVALTQMNRQIDVRAALDAISAPTLIMHGSADRCIPVDNGRYLGRSIKGAQYLEFDSQDHLPWVVQKDADLVIAAIEKLVTGRASARDEARDRVLATVLFTDVVASTERAAELGDRSWKDVSAAHLASARQIVEGARGNLIKTMGDGVLATFDGPARAIRCAFELGEALRPLGLEMRAGLHAGEIELMPDGDISGIAVSIGSRVSQLADGSEVLVSNTVKDLVAGSGIEFDDRGSHSLKGVPGEWHLYSARAG